MRLLIVNILFVLSFLQCYSQKPEVTGRCLNPKFEKTVIKYLSFSVPSLTVSELKDSKEKFILMDAREKDEYKVSHIPGAIHVGYDKFDLNNYMELDKDKPIVVYCSIGYRSEKVADQLSKAGFKNVYNLFGSIFEWTNQGNQLEDEKGATADKVHTYNKSWSKWMDNPRMIKVY
jgi:rhodanese-related sulfurtransferase